MTVQHPLPTAGAGKARRDADLSVDLSDGGGLNVPV